MIGRRDFLAGTAAALLPWQRPQSRHPVPSPAQLAWQRDELALFLHFGVNTFSDREWGDGTEDPASFAPTALDARQWARSAAAAGFSAMILTAKHHDGFCLWPTRTTTPLGGAESVAQRERRRGARVRRCLPSRRARSRDSTARRGTGTRRPTATPPATTTCTSSSSPSCSPTTARFTRSGSTAPTAKGPTVADRSTTGPGTFGLVKRLQPDSVIFSDAGPDVRWIGNEKGPRATPTGPR